MAIRIRRISRKNEEITSSEMFLFSGSNWINRPSETRIEFNRKIPFFNMDYKLTVRFRLLRRIFIKLTSRSSRECLRFEM